MRASNARFPRRGQRAAMSHKRIQRKRPRASLEDRRCAGRLRREETVHSSRERSCTRSLGLDTMCVRISCSPLLQRSRWTRQGGSTRPARRPWWLHFNSRDMTSLPKPAGTPALRRASHVMRVILPYGAPLCVFDVSIPTGRSPSDSLAGGARRQLTSLDHLFHDHCPRDLE